MGVQHSEELKREVVAKWQTGVSKKQLSREYKLDPGTIRRWCASLEAIEPMPGPLSFRRMPRHEAPPPQGMIDAGKRILELVDGLVTAQLEVCKLASDPGWLSQQKPEDLHRWFVTWGDRTVGILAAISEGEALAQQAEELRRQAETAGLAGAAGDDVDAEDSPAMGYGRPPAAT